VVATTFESEIQTWLAGILVLPCCKGTQITAVVGIFIPASGGRLKTSMRDTVQVGAKKEQLTGSSPRADLLASVAK
jgi:hypothetical protein